MDGFYKNLAEAAKFCESCVNQLKHYKHELQNLEFLQWLQIFGKPFTVFTRVSARGAHLILSSQRGAFIRGRRSFEGGAY